MIVLDHAPQAWFLLKDGKALYLVAFCSHSFFDYSVLIAMNAAEVAAYCSKDRTYLDQLAYDIHYSAPAVLGSRSRFKSRNLTVLDRNIDQLANAAIEAWQNSLK